MNIVRVESPVERELREARAQLFALESLVAEAEVDVATLTGELDALDRTIRAALASRYAELDTLLARILDCELRAAQEATADAVDMDEAQRRVEAAERAAAEAHERAQKSAQEAQANAQKSPPEPFLPSEALKALFRRVVHAVHPDRARDEDDRCRRNELMARANAAYEALDEGALNAILAGASASDLPDVGDPREQLVSVLAAITHLETRLAKLKSQGQLLEESELHGLLLESRAADAEGRDFIGELAHQLDAEIEQASARLEELQR